MRRLLLLGLLLGPFLLGPSLFGHQARAAGSGHIYVVFFQEWSAAFDDAADAVIDHAAAQAAAQPDAPVMVAGFADTAGSHDANVLMSELRAQRVYDALVKAGVPAQRIRRSGRGPVLAVGDTQESRRVEIDVGS